MGNLLEEIQRSESNRTSVKAILAALPKEDAEDLQNALVNSAITCAAIQRALKARGYNIGHATLMRYRKDAA
jgi:hypothetical protein